MTWREILQIRGGLHGGESPDPTETNTGETADVLLQVVLPIVLILAFFALQSARSLEHRIEKVRQGVEASEKYRKMLGELEREKEALEAQRLRNEERRKETEKQIKEIEEARQKLDAQGAKLDEQVRQFADWWSEISQTEKGQLAEELSQALLEIQKQRILAALERVEADYRQELGLSFLLYKEIRLNGEGRLMDDHQAFQKACQATARAFRSEEARTGEQARLYLRVLNVAGLADDGVMDVEPSIAGARATGDSLRAQSGRITEANRRVLEERLAQLLARLHGEVLKLGKRVVKAALDHYRSAPLDDLYRRSPEILKLKQEIVRVSREGGDTAPFEEALLRRLFQQVKVDFDRQSYELLPEVWRGV